MKRVLLTGGGGAIGVHVIAHIMHNTDWQIVCLDSFRHKGYKDRIYELFKEHPDWERRVVIIQHDLVCPISRQLKREIGQINYILHLAALSDVFFSVENPAYVIKNNIESTLTMLEYAKDEIHEAFVYFSTDEVYGPALPGQGHAEWETMRPSNSYAASKAASEMICYPYWRSGEVNLIITNTMNNFGEMQSPSKFPAMVQRQLARGEEVTIHGNTSEIGTRFYIHSRNTADALLHILQNKPPHKHQKGELDSPDKYHIVGEKALSNLELAQMISKLMNKPLKYKLVDFHRDNPAHDIHYGLQDNNLKDWSPPLGLEESLKNTIDWQMEHPEWLG